MSKSAALGLLLGCASSFFLCGCGTLATLSNSSYSNSPGPFFYSGTVFDAQTIVENLIGRKMNSDTDRETDQEQLTTGDRLLYGTFWTLDLPVSFVADTAFLPYLASCYVYYHFFPNPDVK